MIDRHHELLKIVGIGREDQLRREPFRGEGVDFLADIVLIETHQVDRQGAREQNRHHPTRVVSSGGDEAIRRWGDLQNGQAQITGRVYTDDLPGRHCPRIWIPEQRSPEREIEQIEMLLPMMVNFGVLSLFGSNPLPNRDRKLLLHGYLCEN